MPSAEEIPDRVAEYARRHLRFGWWSLLFFLTFGLGLETLHGLKVGWYLDVENETRRLMWTLAHAHGPCSPWSISPSASPPAGRRLRPRPGGAGPRAV